MTYLESYSAKDHTEEISNEISIKGCTQKSLKKVLEDDI